MELAAVIYDLTLTMKTDDREVTIHPSAVETDEGLVLFDTGYPATLDQLESALSEHGFGFEDIEFLFLTHQDGDHAGAAADLVEETGATVFAHVDDAPAIDGRETPIKTGDDRYSPVSVDVEVVDGVTLRTAAGPMHVVATPGHTPGHVSLYFPDEKLLIAADALTVEEGELSGPIEQFTPEWEEATESVGKLAALDVDRTLCYHGGPVGAGTSEIEAIYESLTE